jgi:hypothetical protein
MTQKNDIFADLHTRLAEELLARLTKGACQSCGRTPATVQELEAVRKLLSDNGVTDGLRATSPLRSLVDAMPFEVVDEVAYIDRPAKGIA